MADPQQQQDPNNPITPQDPNSIPLGTGWLTAIADLLRGGRQGRIDANVYNAEKGSNPDDKK